MAEHVEVWQVIPDWPYEASSSGRIRNARTGRVLRISKNRKGYLYACLFDRGRKISTAVSVFVASAFHGPRPQGMHTAHLDGNKENNTPANLAYVSPRENAAHKGAHGTRHLGERVHNHKLTARQIEEIRSQVVLGDRFKGLSAFGRKFGVCHTTVADVLTGETWSHLATQPQATEAARGDR